MRHLYLEKAIKRCKHRKKILFVNNDQVAKKIAFEHDATWGRVVQPEKYEWFVDFSRFLGKSAPPPEE